MKKRIRTVTEKSFGDLTSVCELLDCGKSTARKVGKESGALVKLGRLSRYDLGKIRAYLENSKGGNDV